MANEKVTLLDLSFDTSSALDGLDALIAKSIELAEKKKQLQSALKDEQKSMQESSKAFKDGSISQEEYKNAVINSTKSQTELKKQLLEVSSEISDNSKEIKVNTTLLTAQEDSVDSLRAQLAKNTKELNTMSAATRNNTEDGQKLVAETKEITDKLKSMEGAVGDNRRNVGNYSEALTEALTNTKGLSGATGALTSSMGSGINVIKVFNATLKANPVLAIVSAVLGLVALIEKLMKRNSEMAASLKAAFAPFEVIISRVLDNITNMLTVVADAFAWVSENVVNLLHQIGLISDETLKAANSGKALTDSAEDLYRMETNTIPLLQEIRVSLEQQKNLAADQTKSVTERQAALKEALKLTEQMEGVEVLLLKRKYEQIKAQNELSYTSKEDARAEAEALAALRQREADYAVMKKEIIGQESGLRKTEADKAAAAAIAADAKRTAQALANDKKIADERKALQDATIKQMSEALAALDLEQQERAMRDESLKTKLENEKQYAAEALKIEEYRRDQGLISEQEYLNKQTELRLSVLAVENELANEEANKEKERQAMERQAAEEFALAEVQNEFEQRQIALDMEYAQRMEAAERLGADTTAVTALYEKQKEELTRMRINSELTMAAGLAGDLSNLLGSESKAGKAFAVVQATINTYLGATKALASGGFWGIAQAAIVIAAGMKQVAAITKTKDPDTKINTSVKKYAKGGQIFGKSHAQGGVTFRGDNGQVFEAEGGENMYILKKSASAEINALSALNEAHGGRSFSTSPLYKFADGGQVATMQQQNVTANLDNLTLSQKSINQLAEVVIGAVSAMPNPVVSVQDINTGQNDVSVVRNFATY